MTGFHYTALAQNIHFGPGALARLPAALDALGWRFVGLVTTASARRSGRAEQVERLFGKRLDFVFDAAQPHVPAAQVEEVIGLSEAHFTSVLLALGGGSAIGLAKAASLGLVAQVSGPPVRAASPQDQPRVPIAAIPTTYAGSEMTPVVGITSPDGAGGTRKQTYSDPGLAPRLVLYDPALTLDLPPDVTAATGINALAHCVEAVYSTTRNPLSTAAALAGAGRIARALPRCHAHGADLDARTEMLLGAHLAGAALATVSMGLHHGLCHVLGGAAGVPHGVANAIILPHAMCFNQHTAARELAQVAAALGAAPSEAPAATAAQAAIDSVTSLIAGLGLPTRLRDAAVDHASLPRLAALAAESAAVRANPRPASPAELEALLEAAW